MSIFNAEVTEQNGQKLKAYVATPKSGTGPGIVLMHEVYGVTKGIKAVADKFAEEGFMVVCPNMYWRENDDASFKYDPAPETLTAMPEDERNKLKAELAADRDAARDLMFNIVGNSDPAKGPVVNDPAHLAQMGKEIIETIDLCADYLRSHEACNGKVASAGFCFGARNTYLALTQGAKVDAGVSFYPTPKLHEVFDSKAAAGITKPYIFVYGGKDGYISGEEKKAMRDAAANVIRYVAGEDSPLVSDNKDGNPNILTLAYTNNDHGFNRRESKYSDPGTSDHVLTTAAEFLRVGLNDGKAVIPAIAKDEMPQSPTYCPAYKV